MPYLLVFLSALCLHGLVYYGSNAQMLSLSPMIGPNVPGLLPGNNIQGLAGLGGAGGFGMPIQLGNVDGLQGPIQLQDLNQRFQSLNSRRVGVGSLQNNRNFLNLNGNRLGILTADAASQFVESVRGNSDTVQADSPQVDFNQLSDVRNRFGVASGRSLMHQLSPPPERSRGTESSSSGQSVNEASNGMSFQSISQGFNPNELSLNQNTPLQIQTNNIEFSPRFQGQPVSFNINPMQNGGTVQLPDQTIRQRPSSLIGSILGESSFPTQFLANGAGGLDVGQLPLGLGMLQIAPGI